MLMPETWLRTDETNDVAGSIRHALRCGAFVADDPQAWKWIARSLHSALQGACVSHLTTTAAPFGAVTERNAAKWLEYLESGGQGVPPKTYLMALPDLLKAVRRPGAAGGPSNDAQIALSDRELEWLSGFHKTVRDQFVHFEPMGWCLEVSGIGDIGALVARIVGEILDAGWAFRHQEDEWRGALANDLARLGSAGWLKA